MYRLAGFIGCDVAGRDFVLVRSERCQDFALFLFRDHDEVQSASEFCCDFIEFCGKSPSSLTGRPQRRSAPLCTTAGVAA
jgi:hypothetical protein